MRVFAIASITALTAMSFAPGLADAAEPDEPAPDSVAGADPGAEPGEDELEGDPHEAQAKPAKSTKKKRKRSKSKSSRNKPKNDEACDFRTPIHWHEVEAGEHLGLIAGRYGVLSKDIIGLNPALAENPNHLAVGQKLAVCPEIPPREVVVLRHQVQPGETFNAIAYANELTPEELLEMQGGRLRDPNKLRVGDELEIVVVGEIVPGFEPEPPQRGRLVNGRKLPKHQAYTIKRSHNVYGTPRTIKLIGQVVDRYERRVPGGPKLRMGDISKDGGGPMNGHLSHQEGRDVDIGLVLQGKLADRLHFSGANSDNIDLRRTWALVEEFIATGEVRYIFLDYQVQKLLYEYAKQNGVPKQKLDEYFQYPRGIGRNHGIVRHWRGHRNHIHVRFRR
jgi:LysM repeat protein